MRIVRQEKLFYIVRDSHKVYEVDLCEVGDNEYIVNIRYGEKGAKMREGTKTVFPVSYQNALNTFQELVDAKIEKGYESENIPAPKLTVSSPQINTPKQENSVSSVFSTIFSTKKTNVSFKASSKEESILKHLEEACKGNIDKKWKLSRVIWKAGELKITKAVSYIVKLSNNQDPLFQYSVAWTLGRLKQGGDSIPVLMDYYETGDDKVKRMAGEALLENLPLEESQKAVESIVESLPETLQIAIKTDETPEIIVAIHHLLRIDFKQKSADFLYILYLVSLTKSSVRWALLSVLKEITIQRNTFKPIRYIFKMAEFREDAQVFAVVSYQLHQQNSKILASKNNRRDIQYNHAYSQYTKEYFHRRVLRVITGYAQSNKDEYVNFAMEFLLVYQQEEFPKNHLAIHYILHGGSPNWVLERNLSEYHWTDLGIQEGVFHLRQDRLESHSDLWNEQEENIIRLLTQSNSELVLQFASKVFFSNTQWYENIKTSFVLTLLGKESEATAMLGIDIAKKIYDPNQPNTELLLALLKTTYLPAQELALTWVQANPVKLLANWEIVNHLLISISPKIQEWITQSLPLYIKMIPQESLEKALAKTLFLLCDLQEMEKITKLYWKNSHTEIINEQYLKPIIHNLLHCFSEKLFGLSVDVIVRLLSNPLERVQFFGAKILVNHKSITKNLPAELLMSILTARFVSVRAEAIFLLNSFDVYTLMKYEDVLLEQTIRGEEDVKAYLIGLHEYITNSRNEHAQKLLSYLLKYGIENQKTVDFCIQHYFSTESIQAIVKKIPISLLEKWLFHTEKNAQLWAVNALLNHESTEIPANYLAHILATDYLKSNGLILLSKMPTEKLIEQKENLLHLCVFADAETQEGVDILLQKISQNEEISVFFVEELSRNLLRKEPQEGVHQQSLNILKKYFEAYLDILSEKRMWKLIHTNHLIGNELGCLLLSKQDLSKTTLKTLINLANHELLALRQLIWNYFTNNVPRIRYEAEQAIRLLDATWDDSRDFAFNYFEKQFEKEHWTPELLISICDSIREDVQQYGRKLITEFFEDQAGEIYLLHLSQHPSKEVQLMVTNYVERFASQDLENIEKLLPYFATVLMGVNKGRVSKQRIFEFLHKQSKENVQIAEMILPMLTEISLTVSIENKAKIIQILRDIQTQFPHLENPLKVKEVVTI